MNVPNFLSLLRIIMVPIIIILMMITNVVYNISFYNISSDRISIGSNWKIPTLWLIAFILFIIACITDFVDGYIARKYNQITEFGKFMDPVADKILVTSVLIVLVASNIMPMWILIIIVSRDLIVGVLREIGAKKQVTIAADMIGKIKTTIQMIGVACLMIVNANFLNVKIYSWQGQICLIPMYIACLITIISLINYIYKNRILIINSKQD